MLAATMLPVTLIITLLAYKISAIVVVIADITRNIMILLPRLKRAYIFSPLL